jgi:hypothetical protein
VTIAARTTATASIGMAVVVSSKDSADGEAVTEDN